MVDSTQGTLKTALGLPHTNGDSISPPPSHSTGSPWAGTSRSTHGGFASGAGPLPPACETLRSDYSCRAWWRVLLPAEPSSGPLFPSLFENTFSIYELGTEPSTKSNYSGFPTGLPSLLICEKSLPWRHWGYVAVLHAPVTGSHIYPLLHLYLLFFVHPWK